MISAIPINGETWLICGGRDFSDVEMFAHGMRSLIQIRGGLPRRVVQGGANGADAMGERWAKSHALESTTVNADWPKYGRSAGPIRNYAMLKIGIDLVVAFPGGRGTANMIIQANHYRVTVVEIKVNENESKSDAQVSPNVD